ncbi:g8313 [Coccomyxa viridis]|uniref:G8313 protein n=1 Tax=Coccomyxa viridis TaxID=1274662 RepID=A0ABP1G026_9CHLO
MTAAAFCILLLLLIQPLYDMSNLNKQKEEAAEMITHKDHRSVEASAHLAMFLTATNMALPIINRTLGLVKGQIDDLRQKYETKSA